MKSCIAVMKFITARDVLIHYGGYDFMPSEKSIFRMEGPTGTCVLWGYRRWLDTCSLVRWNFVAL